MRKNSRKSLISFMAALGNVKIHSKTFILKIEFQE